MNPLTVQIICASIFIIVTCFLYRYMIRNDHPDRKLIFVATIVLISFITSGFKNYILSQYLQLSYPVSTFLFDPGDRFNDFFSMLKVCSGNNPYGVGNASGSSYFPVANSIMFILGLAGNSYISLVILYVMFTLVLGLFIKTMFGKKLTFENIPAFIIITFTTYPFLFNLDRGNIDMAVFMFLVGFFYFHDKGKPLLSILFLALAISMKLYPAVFLILLLKDKKYKEIAAVIAISVLLTLGALLSFTGTITENIQALLRNLGSFNQDFNSFYGLQHNLSLYGVIRVVTFIFMTLIHGEVIHGVFRDAIPWYSMAVLVLFFGICIYILFFENRKWKNVTMLTIVMLIFPNVSFDYRLIFLFVPLVYFIREGIDSKFRNLYLLLFSLLLVPHNYIYLYWDISTGVLIYPTLMVMIIGLIFYERIRMKNPQTVVQTK